MSTIRSEKVILLICGISLLVENIYSVMQLGMDRGLKFCKQSSMSSVYSLADLTMVQFNGGQWMAHVDNVDEHEHWSLPKKEKTVRQLFFLKADVNDNDYKRFIHTGFTGFLVSSANFPSFPKDTGLLMSTDYDYFLWIRRSKHCNCIACTHFLIWSEGMKDTSIENSLIEMVRGTKNKVMHYIESSNKLIVAYTEAGTAGYQKIYMYNGSLDNIQKINKFQQEQGIIKGLFHHLGRVYYYADRMLGTFNPSTLDFKAEPDRKLAKGNMVYGTKPLLNLLDLFGCLSFEHDEQPKEFSNFNTVNIWLNVVLGTVNTLLFVGIFVFCVLICKQSRPQVNRRDHSRRKTRSGG